MDNEVKEEIQDAPEVQAPEFDNDLVVRMVQEITGQLTKAEMPKEERKAPEFDIPNLETKTSKKGEKLPAWERRSFRFMHGVLNSQSKEAGAREKGMRQLAEYAHQVRSFTDFQKDESDEYVSALIKDSGLSRGIQRRLHSTLTGPAGEFALPKEFMAELHVFIEAYGLARRLARVVPMGSKDLDLKSIATKPTAAWVGEGMLLTESDLALGENVLTTKKLGAVTSITKEQEEDAFVSLLPTWIELLAESIAEKEDSAWLIGDGTSTYGQFTGLANLASAQVNTLGAGDLAFTDVTEDDFRTTRELLSTVRRGGARWIIPRGMWNQIEQFESTVGARIVQSVLTEDAPMRFLGFPVEISEAMDTTAGDVANRDFAILGNYSRSLMGIRRGIAVESSDEAVLSNSSGGVTYNAFQADGILVKISTRIGFQTPTAMQDGFAVMNAPAS